MTVFCSNSENNIPDSSGQHRIMLDTMDREPKSPDVKKTKDEDNIPGFPVQKKADLIPEH